MNHAHANFTTLQRICLVIGLGGLAVSCWMTGLFGWSISGAHAFGLVFATIMAAIIFSLRAHLVNGFGITGARYPLLALGVFFVFFEFVGDLGYTFGMRDRQFAVTGAQQVSYREAQDGIADAKKSIAMFEARKAALEKQLAASDGWSTSVDASGIKAEIVNMEGDRIYKRSKQCADVTLRDSRDFCDKLTGLRSRAAAAAELVDVRAQIVASQKVIDQKRGEAAKTPVGHSTARAQNVAFARIGLLFTGADDAMNPDAVSMTVADYVIGLLMAIAATLLPPVALYFAFWGPAAQARKVHGEHAPPMTIPDAVHQPSREIGQPFHNSRLMIAAESVANRLNRRAAA